MLNKIIDFCSKFWGQFIDLIKWVFETIFILISSLFYYIFDAFLTVIETIFNTINFAEITALTSIQSWTGLDTQIIWVLNYINLTTCLGFIIAAYSIRLLLNLIPASLTRI